MPERYRCFKEIDYMFKDLRGRIIEKNQKIKETAHWYIVNQAVYDLEKYRASLPSEAVYEICYCLKERAGLLEYKPDQYQWNEFLKDMRSAQMLYQENGLLADSALCALNIMDEGLAEFNIDSEYKPLYLDTIKISLQEVEKILPELMEHPVLKRVQKRRFSSKGGVRAFWEPGFSKPVKKSIKDVKSVTLASSDLPRRETTRGTIAYRKNRKLGKPSTHD